MADKYQENKALVLELLSSTSTATNVALSSSIASSSAFVSTVVDERPERDKLCDSLDDWSDERFVSFYRMTKRMMLYVCDNNNEDDEMIVIIIYDDE